VLVERDRLLRCFRCLSRDGEILFFSSQFAPMQVVERTSSLPGRELSPPSLTSFKAQVGVSTLRHNFDHRTLARLLPLLSFPPLSSTFSLVISLFLFLKAGDSRIDDEIGSSPPHCWYSISQPNFFSFFSSQYVMFFYENEETSEVEVVSPNTSSS